MSLKPGVGVHAEVTNPPAKATGVIQNPMTPVEYGRTAEKSKYTVTDDSRDLPDFASGLPTGELTSLTVTGDAAVAQSGSGTYTATVAGTGVNTSAGTFLWAIAGGTGTIASAAAASTAITFDDAAAYTVTCTYTESGVTGSPVSGNTTVTVS